MEPTQVRLTIRSNLEPDPAHGASRRSCTSHRGGLRRPGLWSRKPDSVSGPEVVDSIVSVFSRLIHMVEREVPTTDGGAPRGPGVAQRQEPADMGRDLLLTYRGRAIRPKTAKDGTPVESMRRTPSAFRHRPRHHRQDLLRRGDGGRRR